MFGRRILQTAVLAVAVVGLLSSCKGNANQSNAFNWTSGLNSYHPSYREKSVAEKDGAFYYLSANKLMKVDVEGEDSTVVFEDDSPIYGLCLDVKNVYFFTADNVKSYNIESGEVKTLLQSNIKDTGSEIAGIVIHDDYLYIFDTGISVVRLNLSGGEAERFLDDVSSMCFIKDECYYTSHTEMTRGIIKKNTVTGEESVLTDGNTVTDDHRLIDSVISADGELYYSTRSPAAVYKYVDGVSDIIIRQDEKGDIINNSVTFIGSNDNGFAFRFRDVGDKTDIFYFDGSKLHTVTVWSSLEVSPFTVGNRLFYKLKGADTFTVTELTD